MVWATAPMDVTQLITTLELVAPIVSALKPSRDFLSLSLDTRVHQFEAVASPIPFHPARLSPLPIGKHEGSVSLPSAFLAQEMRIEQGQERTGVNHDSDKCRQLRSLAEWAPSRNQGA
jgi:hypothetical protein